MKAVGRNLIIQKIEQGTTRTEGGLLLSKNDKEDIRYVEADIISIGEGSRRIKRK